MPRPHPPGERVWLHKPEFLGLAEVPKPCNCRCKNAKWFALKHESHHHTIAILAMYLLWHLQDRYCKCETAQKTQPPGLPTKLFEASSASSSTLHSQKYSPIWTTMCARRTSEKALMAYNTYQAILRERHVDRRRHKESSNLSGVSKLPEGEASPSATTLLLSPLQWETFPEDA